MIRHHKFPRVSVVAVREGAKLPTFATEGSAGADLHAHLESGEMILDPGQHRLVETGLSVAIPAGHEGQVRPRSGLAAKHGVTVLNSPGTIDADYRGELKVILINHGDTAHTIRHGDRIAQLVIAPVLTRGSVEYVFVDDLEQTDRGSSGFGSTGR